MDGLLGLGQAPAELRGESRGGSAIREGEECFFALVAVVLEPLRLAALSDRLLMRSRIHRHQQSVVRVVCRNAVLEDLPEWVFGEVRPRYLKGLRPPFVLQTQHCPHKVRVPLLLKLTQTP